MTEHNDGWAQVTWRDWADHEGIRRRLEAGADPDGTEEYRPLHRAVQFGTPETVAELARRVADVDAPEDGSTALWEAVLSGRPEHARALAAAGADPWRPQFGGWSPGRLGLAGPGPELFPVPRGERGLTEAERAAVVEGRRLVAALGEIYDDGLGLACVAGIDADEAIRRMEASPLSGEELDRLLEDPYAYGVNGGSDTDRNLELVGVTSVPGGCVVTQPWGYAPQLPGVQARLSRGTHCYGLYANPKSGNQGSVARDGAVERWDLHPGGDPCPDDSAEEVLAAYLFQDNAVAYACAYAGLRLTDARAIVGPPDVWCRLPRRDYWKG